MNFLAHLHIADHCNSHFMGNLLGDFVKGDPSKLYDSDITNGIKLHRFVDRITDHHPIVEECKPHFKGVARRFAPIALDMFWDHCLAKHWNDFHQESLDDFVEFAFQKVDQDVHEPLPARFMLLHQRMWRGGWLQSYQDLSNIEFALHRMSQRSPRMADLTTTFEVLDGEYAALESNFSELYQDVLRQSLEFHQQLSSS
ncbi:ACP phosphodiesterase [Vibrio parahaemolyticus]|uniref:Acyl carrier protein phosphodiesterase n=2 Tax=Vibrio parahaemolyticus TaxID=670 RepID=Q87HW2_VIBPA|nr:ACP phosphodiesterase [Vibrio parahaemolyticus]EFO34925.1 acyl carrier protein phosphodiesterase (ACPphosphodiesterase) [Vibrio parahaemolyticus Peru-466]EFO51911.1 acyl carrier protein phosphodiesterase [Vibrio parahaemolyticus K5030]ARC21467.1 ACP phosphodiesterase [Vibrio parahaemolyticus]AYF22131.1 Acyl carrier protein phosphodiesterase [Vibrio parahaemolyticus]AZV73130.1 ACP phosphodiesterase [Vibrio parahaemolyticus]